MCLKLSLKGIILYKTNVLKYEDISVKNKRNSFLCQILILHSNKNLKGHFMSFQGLNTHDYTKLQWSLIITNTLDCCQSKALLYLMVLTSFNKFPLYNKTYS